MDQLSGDEPPGGYTSCEAAVPSPDGEDIDDSSWRATWQDWTTPQGIATTLPILSVNRDAVREMLPAWNLIKQVCERSPIPFCSTRVEQQKEVVDNVRRGAEDAIRQYTSVPSGVLPEEGDDAPDGGTEAEGDGEVADGDGEVAEMDAEEIEQMLKTFAESA
jgi:hypothetical protein